MWIDRPSHPRTRPSPGHLTTDRPRRGWRSVIDEHAVVVGAITAVAVIVLSGCRLPGSDPGLGQGVTVTNKTELTLHFEVFARGTSYDLSPVVEPRQTEGVVTANELRGDSLIGENGCTIGDLVALAPDGDEVARHPPPLCTGDVWVIEVAEANSSP
jgi:hypothetical protein